MTNNIIPPKEFKNEVMPCQYCGIAANLVPPHIVYQIHTHIDPTLRFWHCPRCGAYVGCHPGTEIPLGSLASAQLRNQRRMVHYHLDKLWTNPAQRKVLYKELADILGIPEDDMHVGWMNEDDCAKLLPIVMDKYSRLIQQKYRIPERSPYEQETSR